MKISPAVRGAIFGAIGFPLLAAVITVIVISFIFLIDVLVKEFGTNLTMVCGIVFFVMIYGAITGYIIGSDDS